ncbi:MAG: ShlB/FhaC/HecB family hemolysin secretion/activation protein [Hydrogenophaga sp.]|nr:ShlB/FhaC/HecB family hemolysin secretion/activation protein [Hydrogenophaga sp.]NIN28475.1 ShlB/FhaC/HecB family hemolysin secretion/activation protein [Hydrogenophaga sp.]NIN32934.1 ShlB/FhaC/HecB family hemolysin secretion/activation protein [Hydrogenophaga sp.]NIN57609.1 ShlB/FhaC/HecB family hemolysin secretion/activation protein [Hydrogenophaga sp.]NIO53904.1 ShlB/FhaC/HecB family hemolysin secretion/activation protein [Hydrogenophaga sp.]
MLQRGADVRGATDAPLAPLEWPAQETPCFPIRDIVLTGAGSDRFRFILQDLIAGPDPAIGRCLGAKGVDVAAERAQRALVAHGYVTTRLLVQPQSFDAGRLVLSVVPGRLRASRFADGTSARATAINAVPARPGDILNLRDIEQALENFKRVPSVESEIVIEPAVAPDESDLVIAWQQSNPLRLNASLDDSGTRATGRYQGSVTVSYDHWWTLNDLFYVTYTHDLGGGVPGIRGTNGKTVHYSLPWGRWLLGFTASHSNYHQNVAGPFEIFTYSGSSDNADLTLSRVLHRDARGKTSLSLKAWARRSDNFINDAEVEPQRRATGGWALGLAHRQAFNHATLDLQIEHRRGTAAFNARPAPEEEFAEGTSRLRVTSFDASLQVPWRLADRRGRYQLSLRGQWNGTPLAAPDRFAIGGRYTVRGFDGETSLSADRGLLMRNEFAVAIGDTAHEAYVGIDYGQVSGPSAEWLAGDHLAGAVLGIRGGAGVLAYDVFVGRPISRPAAFRPTPVVAGFSLSASF